MRQHVFTSFVCGLAVMSACSSDTSQQTPSAADSMGPTAVSGAAGASSANSRSDTSIAGSTPAPSVPAGMRASAGVGGGSCESLPAVTDYGAPGPFNDAKMYTKTGPSDNYTIFRPSDSLGKDGFKHPIVTWGNGILTTPDMYQKLLLHVASHGFVIIGCNDTQAERPCLDAGMEWLAAQDSAAGELQGKLDTSRELAPDGGADVLRNSAKPRHRTSVYRRQECADLHR